MIHIGYQDWESAKFSLFYFSWSRQWKSLKLQRGSGSTPLLSG